MVQDCLTLLANLLRSNGSNQSLFREIGFITKLCDIMPGGRQGKSMDHEDWQDQQGSKNLWGLLAVLRIFLTSGSVGTPMNQAAFERTGLLSQVLNLGFDNHAPIPIRTEALYTCADIIRENSKLQECFASLQVAPVKETTVLANGDHPHGTEKVYVIEGLLDLALIVSSPSFLGARYAALDCILAYCSNHTQIRQHFLERAIDGHQSGRDEHANIISILLTEGTDGDPYRIWFAATVLFHLTFEDTEAKRKILGIVEGNAEHGEETVTLTQTLAGNLLATVSQSAADRLIPIGILQVLLGLLFDSPECVNDFLIETTSVPAFIALITNAPTSATLDPLIPGLICLLLVTAYEFSTKESPISRRDLQPLILTQLTREKFIATITALRQDPLLRDYEVLPPNATPFDPVFVAFLKDNYSRLSRAIDRPPSIEITPAGQVKGVDRDLLDDLRAELTDRSAALRRADEELLMLRSNLERVEADARRAHETSRLEHDRIREINANLQRNHEQEIHSLEDRHAEAIEELEEAHRKKFEDLSSRIRASLVAAQTEAKRDSERQEAEINRLRGGMENLTKTNKILKEDLAETRKQRETARGETESARREADDSRNESARVVKDLEQARQHREEQVAETERSRQRCDELQKELDQSKASATKLEIRVQELENTLDDAKQQVEAMKKQLSDKDIVLSSFKDRVKALQEGQSSSTSELEARNQDITKVNAALETARIKLEEAEKEAKDKEEARESAQSELDDLLMLLSDLEEKKGSYKSRLKALGEDVSEGEGEGEDEDGDLEEVEKEGRESADAKDEEKQA